MGKALASECENERARESSAERDDIRSVYPSPSMRTDYVVDIVDENELGFVLANAIMVRDISRHYAPYFAFVPFSTARSGNKSARPLASESARSIP